MKRIELSHMFGRNPLWIAYVCDDDEVLAARHIDPAIGIALTELEAFTHNTETGRWVAT